MKRIFKFITDILKNACSKHIETAILSSGIITTIALSICSLKTLNICYTVIFWIVFVLTLFFALSLLCNFIHNEIEKHQAYKYFCSLSKNWDLYFSEKMLIKVLCRRNMQIFNYQMISKGFLDEYINYINENYNPDDDVMERIYKAERDVETIPCVLTLISNLENCKFIYKVKNIKDTYKINSFIWNKERKIYKDEKKLRIKK